MWLNLRVEVLSPGGPINNFSLVLFSWMKLFAIHSSAVTPQSSPDVAVGWSCRIYHSCFLFLICRLHVCSVALLFSPTFCGVSCRDLGACLAQMFMCAVPSCLPVVELRLISLKPHPGYRWPEGHCDTCSCCIHSL